MKVAKQRTVYTAHAFEKQKSHDFDHASRAWLKSICFRDSQKIRKSKNTHKVRTAKTLRMR